MRTSLSPDGNVLAAPRWGELTSNAGLVIEEIGSDHLDIRAVGSFDELAVDAVAARLKQLVACADHLRIDFRSGTEMCDAVASLFRAAATTVEAAGGTFNVVGLNRSLDQSGPTTSSETANDRPHQHLGTGS